MKNLLATICMPMVLVGCATLNRPSPYAPNPYPQYEYQQPAPTPTPVPRKNTTGTKPSPRPQATPRPTPVPTPVSVSRPASGPVQVTIYGADWCGPCRNTKANLEARHVKYHYVNIDTDPVPEAVRMVIDGNLARGMRPAGIPVAVLPNGTIIKGADNISSFAY